MKPLSGIAVVPRDSARAMHSDSKRPLGKAEWTATYHQRLMITFCSV